MPHNSDDAPIDETTPVHPALQILPKVRPAREGPRQVELILVGRDLLQGHVADENTHLLAAFFAERGDRVDRVTMVGDDEKAIGSALRESLERNPHLVIVSGGLGPASDDRTMAAVSSALGLPLTLSPMAKTIVEQSYQRLYRAKMVRTAGLNLVREKLCRIPVSGEPVANGVGAVPGVILRLTGGSAVICLPGKPEELREMLEDAVGRLRDFSPKSATARRTIESPTADESSLRPLLDRLAQEFPSLWISSRPVGSGRKSLQVLVVLESSGANPEEANSRLAAAVQRLLALASGA